MTPRATYRFQFNRDFPFAKAEELVPYLDRLGISHVYASPITAAVPGSGHGYDVIDPTIVNPELGGEEALRSLVAAMRAKDMGLIIDIVPNHMGVAGGHNPYWNDVLMYGQQSEYADWFDIDWRKPVLLPILGAPLQEVLAEGQIAIDRSAAKNRCLRPMGSIVCRSGRKTMRTCRRTATATAFPRFSTVSIIASPGGAARMTS